MVSFSVHSNSSRKLCSISRNVMTLKRQSSYLSTRPSKSGNEPKPFFTMNRSRPPFVSLSLILPCKITTSFSTSCRREVCLASIACISERSIPTVTLSSSFVAMVSTQLRAYAPSSATMQDGYGGCAILFLSQRMSVSRIVCCEQTERRERKQHNTNRNHDNAEARGLTVLLPHSLWTTL